MMSYSSLTVNLVVAMSRNGVIGRNNQLPWRLPGDLAYFKSVTWGHPILMGRKTYESIGRPLPGRLNLVLTRSQQWRADGVTVVGNVEQGLSEAAGKSDSGQLMVIGGENVYRQFLPLADRLFITLVDAEIEGDAHFPSVDWSNWQRTHTEPHSADERNPYEYAFDVYERKE